jgi:hypothetical protein
MRGHPMEAASFRARLLNLFFGMPGLDPGIQHSSRQAFSKKIDHRVKPGDNEFEGLGLQSPQCAAPTSFDGSEPTRVLPASSARASLKL